MNFDNKKISTNPQAELERQIDDALGLYAKAEPRPGLEGRLLARLSEARTQSKRSWRWCGAIAFGTAALAIAVVWLGLPNRGVTIPKIPMAKVEVPKRSDVSHAGRTDQKSGPANQPAPSIPASTRQQRIADWRVQANNSPKLDRFPSPRNLSEEELLLVRRLNEQSDMEVLLEAAATRAEVDLRIDSLEIRPLEIPDIEISESKTN